MRVAACQLPEIRNDMHAAAALVEHHAAAAARAGARLVCFPECFLQGYDSGVDFVANAAVDLAGGAFRRVLDGLKAVEPVLIVGVIERDGDSLYNTAVAIERGKVVARYRKTHLLKVEQAAFAAGSGPVTFDVDGMTVGIAICYDLNFGGLIGRTASAGAKALFCPCSNMMPRALAEAWKPRHNKIRARQARDHGVWIVTSDIVGEREDRVSYGPTAVIDPSGAVVAQVPLLEAGMVVAEIG
jgi:predicted amidohydrolase